MKIVKQSFKSLLLVLTLLLSSCSKDNDSSNTDDTIPDDPNDPVEITVSTSDFTTTIDENPFYRQVLGVVEGSTNQGVVKFFTEPSGQIPPLSFSVDSLSGELTVRVDTNYDYETNTSVTGIVKVVNGSVFENSTITININDIYEKTYTGDVLLLTQEEVDLFGVNDYTVITGKLEIGSVDSPNNSITDLSPLSSIVTVGSDFSILQNNSLTNLNGLGNITTIGNHLKIIQNDVLIDISSLINIISVENSINIMENNLLPTIDGLNNIAAIHALIINANQSLTNIDGLAGVETIEGSVIYILDNPALLNVDGLANVIDFSNRGLRIENNPSLGHIDILNNTNTLRYIHINNNTSLENINGFSGLTKVTEDFQITENPNLNSISGLNNLTTVIGKFSLKDSSLENLNGLNGLASLDILYIYNNNGILNLDELNNLSEVRSLGISSNERLYDFCGLQNLFLSSNELENFSTWGNAYNPTEQDIINGNCSL